MPRLRPSAVVAAVVAAIVLVVSLAYSTTPAHPSTVTANNARRSTTPLLFDNSQQAPSKRSWNTTGLHERITYVGGENWDGIFANQCHTDDEDSCLDMFNPDRRSCDDDEVKVGHVAGCNSENIEYGNAICCPITAAPTWCTWRGGEEQESKVCNGQCHEGELTLFSSEYGGRSLSSELTTPLRKCLKGGKKVFCCRSDHWSSFLDNGCAITGCSESCPIGHDELGRWKDDDCPIFDHNDIWGRPRYKPGEKMLCCPSPSKIIDGCRWTGEAGDCSDNKCERYEVEMRRSPHGLDYKACPYGRQRALCCKVASEPPFLPVKKVNLWPELPPENDLANYDIQYVKKIGDQQQDGIPSKDPFGWLMIDGPPAVFGSAKQKRDGSPSSLEFLDCHKASGEHRQSVRFVCSSEDPGTDCDHITEDGLEGKVIEMPDNCGAGKYAVAHHIEIASDQSLPEHLSQIANKTVLDLTFDYDFGLMKRGAGDVFFRADYDNMGGVNGNWDSVVVADPISQRDLGKRFWSPNSDAWREKFTRFHDKVRQTDKNTFLGQEYEQVLLSSFTDCGSDGPAYADIRASGKVSSRLKVWATLFGVLGPVARIDHASVFTSAEIDASMQLNVSISGNLKTDTMIADLFPQSNLDGFYHPGLISIQPTLSAEVALTADVDMFANFTTPIRIFTRDGDPIIQSWPVDFYAPTGQSDFDAPSNAFQGVLGSVRDDSKIQVDLKASLGLQITLNGTDGISLKNRGVPNQRPGYGVYAAAAIIGSNVFELLFGQDQNLAVFNNSLIVQGARGGITNLLGDRLFDRLGDPNLVPLVGTTQGRRYAQEIFVASEAEAGYGKIRPWPIEGKFDKVLFWARQLLCPVPIPIESSSCDINLCALEPGGCPEEEDCEYQEEQSSDTQLVRRGGPRPCKAQFSDGSVATWESLDYPPPGDLFKEYHNWFIYPLAFDYAQANNCFDMNLTATEITQGVWHGRIQPQLQTNAGYNVEHIIEVQTIPRFVEFAVRGRYLRSGARANFIPINRRSSKPRGLLCAPWL